MQRARLLLVIPDDDISLKLFFTKECQAKMSVKSIVYHDASLSSDKDWDFIYIRGPFVQSDFDNQDIKSSIDEILQNRGDAYTVDGLQRFSDLLLEDKWRQYKLFAKMMPSTELMESFKNTKIKDQVIKKRISGRSRDIHFNIASLPKDAVPGNYIIQKRLNIQTEYRAFMVGGELILPLEIKTSKTESTKNHVVGLEEGSPKEIEEICRQVYEKLKFDLMGLDIAETKDGYYLLEVNRSCQFMGYFGATGLNLAMLLNAYLLNRLH